jgi:predicted acetyltransferase
MRIKFIMPDYHLRDEYTEMMDEWIKDGSRIAPWSLIEQYHTDEEFDNVIRITNEAVVGNMQNKDFVPCKTFYVKDTTSGKMLGAVNIRYYLTKSTFETWGHIGFGVRPSERKKGYATEMLNMALDECRQMKMEKVFLGCLDENIASAKTIEKCGGILRGTILREYGGNNVKICQYYIEL